MAKLNRSSNAIKNAAIFAGLSPDQFDLVVNHATLKQLPPGVVLFRQGEPAKEMFLLEQGRVRMYEVTAHGRELLIRFVRPLEIFGDKAVIRGSEYGAFAESQTSVRAYVWTTDSMAVLLEQVPQIATNLFIVATQYLHYSRQRYRMLAAASAKNRIRWALTELARNFGCAQPNSTAITGRSVQRDIADLSMTTIYTVSRVLRGYEQKGILSRKRGRIVLSTASDKVS